jgi:hypothetical protein
VQERKGAGDAGGEGGHERHACEARGREMILSDIGGRDPMEEILTNENALFKRIN